MNIFSKIKNKIFPAKIKVVSEEDKLSFYSSLIPKGSLIFDIGANEGNRVATFLNISNKIIAIEPQPSCIAKLKEKFGDAIIIEPIGIADQSGELELQIADESTISTFSTEFSSTLKKTRFKRNEWKEKILVPVHTLQELLEKHGKPFFCKIDVEGFEVNVLKGLRTSLPLISFEYCVPEFTDKVLECAYILNHLNPLLEYNYSIGESMQMAIESWYSYEQFKSVIQTNHFSDTLFGDVYIREPKQQY